MVEACKAKEAEEEGVADSTVFSSSDGRYGQALIGQ